jgi:hypothetical protein
VVIEAPLDTESLVRLFLDRTLPKPAWTHVAHLRVGLWHVRRFGAERAIDLLRERIKSYNEAVGTANTDTSGYHETLTVFYVKVIDAFVSAEASRQDEPANTLEPRLLEAIGGRELPLRHYSRACLFSAGARRQWVAPDLQPLS